MLVLLPRVQQQLGVPTQHVIRDVYQCAESKSEGGGTTDKGRRFGGKMTGAMEHESLIGVDCGVVVDAVNVFVVDKSAVMGSGGQR